MTQYNAPLSCIIFKKITVSDNLKVTPATDNQCRGNFSAQISGIWKISACFHLDTKN